MNAYETKARFEMGKWKMIMRTTPNIFEKASKGVQKKLNDMLPAAYHDVITASVKNLAKVVLFGSKFVSMPPARNLSLLARENMVREKTRSYKTTAVIEGAATGAGGVILSMADFPLLLGIKMKYLYDVASIYGFDLSDYKERIYLLHIFQLAFSGKANVNKVFARMEHWDKYSRSLPSDMNLFDWKTFQQEYRDYIDLAKLLQMVPGIGAFVGSYVNARLLNKLSNTAVQSYRMRIFK
jgi:hypothetical protein